MKKTYFLLISILFSLALNAQTVSLTLNGIDASVAKTMITHFQNTRTKDQKPQPTTIWFSKDEIKKIAGILNSEFDPNAKINYTDGVRIYFIRDPLDDDTKPTYKVAIVSTKFAGTFKSHDTTYNWHMDYYTHAANDPLFFNVNLKTLEGELQHNENQNNARLYEPYVPPGVGIPDEEKDCDFSIYHFRNRKAATTLVSNFGKHAINTYGVWFDIVFINYLATTLQNKPSHSGIRIYFATHSADDSNNAFADRETFVITTTDSTANTDYFYCDDTPATILKLKTAKKHTLKITGRRNFKNISKDYLVSASQDKGELCPFNCN